MALDVLFLPAARLEYAEAREWYAQRSTRAAEGFVAEVDRQIQRIAENPSGFQLMMDDVRRVRLRGFPYSLFFRVGDGVCFVIACFHASRDPKIWEERS
jgi:plasmid stabilization system protein ParE